MHPSEEHTHENGEKSAFFSAARLTADMVVPG
jgi:hypothetical protein